jgi:hypothetical protein
MRSVCTPVCDLVCVCVCVCVQLDVIIVIIAIPCIAPTHQSASWVGVT